MLFNFIRLRSVIRYNSLFYLKDKFQNIVSQRFYVKKNMTEKWKTDLRLSPDIQPMMYDVFLHPKMDLGVFSGHVEILIDVKGVESHISIHVKGLNITSTRITLASNSVHEIHIADAFEYPEHEFWVIIPKKKLHRDHYKLHLDFNGQLTNKIVGFYLSQYLDKIGNQRSIVTSKFEPTFARQAFPCFDEPSFKAEYIIKLVRPSDKEYIALSNMNLQEEIEDKPNTGEVTAIFATSVRMSTYLVCFIVCDFAHLKSSVSDGKFPVTVYARNNEINNMQYANDIAINVTNYYCHYFDIPYPLPKLDLIAIPDFVSGAMENWGLITFRETSIFYNKKITSTKGQFRVALTVAHELAHMWFGNLVTMKWWNDLWLNEGYATFMEYKGVAHMHPTWNLDAMFLIYDLHSVLELDSTLNSHPIVHDVINPDQITEIFDTISYSKGASVIRMLEATMGDENFRKGIRSYLNSFIYGNAETKDLWYHMQHHAEGYNVASFMDTWTCQMGYPLITVSRTDEMVTFKQERYLADPNVTYDKNESPFKYQWEVPITYITSSNSTPKLVWLHRDQQSVSVILPKNTTWLKVNYRQKGYYRVNYDLSEWYNLIEMSPENYAELDSADRANLLNDAFNLADSEIITYDIPLKLSNYLTYEDNVVPWAVAQTEFLSLRNKLQETLAYNSSALYVQNLLTQKQDHIWSTDEDSSFLDRFLQTTLFKLGCSVGHPEFIRQATQMFLQQLKNTDRSIRLTPDLSESIYYYGIENTGDKEWDKLWEIFIGERNPQEKLKLMVGLTASRNPDTLKGYLLMAKNESYVRTQDYLNLLINTAVNPVGSPVVWNFVRDEWPFLVERYTLNDRYLGQMVKSTTKNFATEERLNEMKNFFAKYPDAGAGTTSRKQALEKVQLNIKWRENHLKKLNEWFETSVGKIDEST